MKTATKKVKKMYKVVSIHISTLETDEGFYHVTFYRKDIYHSSEKITDRTYRVSVRNEFMTDVIDEIMGSDDYKVRSSFAIYPTFSITKAG